MKCLNALIKTGQLCAAGLILHEEHIELLTEDYKLLKAKVDGQTLQEGSLHFTGETRLFFFSIVLVKTLFQISFLG